VKKLSDLTNRIVSSSASLVAVIALGTSLYEARLNREQQRASVWPYVTQGNTGTYTASYARVVRNVGIGPAKVRSFQVWVRGRPRHSWREVFDAVHAPVSGSAYLTAGLARGMVLPPGVEVKLLAISDSAAAVVFAQRLKQVDTRICYCSLYDECWADARGMEEPEPVDSCPAEPALEFEK
jgi:hypothetical protein